MKRIVSTQNPFKPIFACCLDYDHYSDPLSLVHLRSRIAHPACRRSADWALFARQAVTRRAGVRRGLPVRIPHAKKKNKSEFGITGGEISGERACKRRSAKHLESLPSLLEGRCSIQLSYGRDENFPLQSSGFRGVATERTGLGLVLQSFYRRTTLFRQEAGWDRLYPKVVVC
jgi:hypothetical protein